VSIVCFGNECFFFFANYFKSRSTAFPEKYGITHIFTKFHNFYRIIWCISVFIQPRYWILSWATQIQSIYSQPTSFRTILALSLHVSPNFLSGVFFTRFPTKPSLLCVLYIYVDYLISLTSTGHILKCYKLSKFLYLTILMLDIERKWPLSIPRNAAYTSLLLHENKWRCVHCSIQLARTRSKASRDGMLTKVVHGSMPYTSNSELDRLKSVNRYCNLFLCSIIISIMAIHPFVGP
jgi:hypothetical protein